MCEWALCLLFTEERKRNEKKKKKKSRTNRFSTQNSTCPNLTPNPPHPTYSLTYLPNIKRTATPVH